VSLWFGSCASLEEMKIAADDLVLVDHDPDARVNRVESAVAGNQGVRPLDQQGL
jgi:hypothetical protein